MQINFRAMHDIYSIKIKKKKKLKESLSPLTPRRHREAVIGVAYITH